MLIDTLVGGALTVTGGFFATLYIRSLDRRAADRASRSALRGATIGVLDEMAANLATLQVTLDHDPYSIPKLHDEVYLSEHRVLVQGLPEEVRLALADAYIYARADRVLIQTVRTITPSITQSMRTEMEQAAMAQVEACYEKTVKARDLLQGFRRRPVRGSAWLPRFGKSSSGNGIG